MEVQTRSETNGVKFHTSISAAFKQARRDGTIWKISFNAEDGTRIRLIKMQDGWKYESLMVEVEKILKDLK